VEAMAFDAIKDKQRIMMRVSITKQDGGELDQVLYLGSEEEVQAAEVEAQIDAILKKTKRIGVVAASRAIGKALTAAKDSVMSSQNALDGRMR